MIQMMVYKVHPRRTDAQQEALQESLQLKIRGGYGVNPLARHRHGQQGPHGHAKVVYRGTRT